MDFDGKIRLLATTQKILYDVITLLSNKDNNNKPFEIGCKCKTPEIQLKLNVMLSGVFSDFENIVVKMKDEDEKHIVCVSRENI